MLLSLLAHFKPCHLLLGEKHVEVLLYSCFRQVWIEARGCVLCTKKPVMNSDHRQLSSRRFISWSTTAQLKRVRDSFQGLPPLQAWPRCVLDLAFFLTYFHISTFSLHHVSSRAFGAKTVRKPNNSPQFLCVVPYGDKGASHIFMHKGSPQIPAAREWATRTFQTLLQNCGSQHTFMGEICDWPSWTSY